MDDLGDDMVVEILVLFPAKACLRFKRVCRRWRSLISDPVFAIAHLRRSLRENPNPPQGLLNTGIGRFVSLKLIDGPGSWQDAPERTDLHVGRVFREGRGWRILGCCHGLVCIRRNGCRIFLYNPTTRESKELHKPRHLGKIGSSPVSGLGYDALNDDFKFIISTSNGKNGRKGTFIIYSLKSDSWRCIGDYNGSSGLSSYGKYCQGSLYWLARHEGAAESIVSFDVATEKFRDNHSPMPSFTIPKGRTELKVSEAGWLFLYRESGGQIEVWIIKDARQLNSNWTKLCRFPLLQIFFYNSVYPLIKDGKVVIFFHQSVGSDVGVYDPEDDSTTTFVLRQGLRYSDHNTVTYVESLVSLPQ